ncbi:MAG TPA: hypothetical protein VHV77_16550 [Pirellulales bacterium]|nr:hypothetical protein [Pirellulales bacterium]
MRRTTTFTGARFFALAIGLLMTSGTPLAAQQGALEDIYGKGVHAYFRGDVMRTFQDMTAAINAGSRDPRVYYFRGLAYLQMGSEWSARDDFAKAAQLESGQGDSFYDVGKSLERVQGPTRHLLESYRAGARLAATQLREQRRMEQFENLRRQGGGAPPIAMPPGATPESVMPPNPTTPEQPTTPATPPTENPFGM